VLFPPLSLYCCSPPVFDAFPFFSRKICSPPDPPGNRLLFPFLSLLAVITPPPRRKTRTLSLRTEPRKAPRSTLQLAFSFPFSSGTTQGAVPASSRRTFLLPQAHSRTHSIPFPPVRQRTAFSQQYGLYSAQGTKQPHPFPPTAGQKLFSIGKLGDPPAPNSPVP